jgi:fructose-1,6-bisphosphatase/inositol monophosphatase family enzyme
MASSPGAGRERGELDLAELCDWLLDLQRRIQRLVAEALSSGAGARPAQVAREGVGDTLYEIDRALDEVVLAACEELGERMPFLLIAEGCTRPFPAGVAEGEARMRLIMDPLDGTRGIMYDKRSAWTLAAVAPNRGPETTLADIVLAVQTEVPTTKQHLADSLWALPGGGAHALRRNLLTGEELRFTPRPSAATDLSHGFAMLSKFFPGRKAVAAEIEEQLFARLPGLLPEARVRVFDDQYISTGGQLYELAVGHDRFNGDLRAALMQADHLPGYAPGLAAHAYDICTELIAREAGVVVTDLRGQPLDCRLAEDENVAWLAYANRELQATIEPVLQQILREHGLL